jgi:hypothetical protein
VIVQREIAKEDPAPGCVLSTAALVAVAALVAELPPELEIDAIGISS